MPKRVKQHEIDTKAQAILQAAWPEWSLNRYTDSDYGKDYIVDVFTKGIPTPHEFYVQLKGTENLSRSKEYCKFPMGCDHLTSYLENSQLPVFLVVCDTLSSNGYFLFVQKYLFEINALPKLSKQKHLTLWIPAKNNISDKPHLLKEVEAATNWMISHKIRIQEWLLERKDPRMKVKIDANNQGTNLTIDPIEPIELKAKYNGSLEELDKIMDSINRGITIEKIEGDLRIGGSPILPNEQVSKISFQCNEEALVTITSISKTGDESILLDHLPMTCAGGKAERRFEVKNENLPIGLKIVATILSDDKAKMSAKFSFKLDLWIGKNVQKLFYFSNVKRFLNSILSNCRLSIELTKTTGEILTTGSPDIPKSFDVKNIAFMLEFIETLRRVAKALSLDINLPATVDRDDYLEMREIDSLLTGNAIKNQLPNKNLSVSFTREGAKNALATTNIESFPVTLHLEKRYKMYGFDISFPYDIELQNVTLTNRPEVLELISKGESVIPLRYTTLPDCIRTVRYRDACHFPRFLD